MALCTGGIIGVNGVVFTRRNEIYITMAAAGLVGIFIVSGILKYIKKAKAKTNAHQLFHF
jgi:hypothetical protein